MPFADDVGAIGFRETIEVDGADIELYWLLRTSVREKDLWAVIASLFLSVRWNSAIDPGGESFSSTRENTEVWAADSHERHARTA
jgi:hypothetical protein